jgi:hypothetical protein
MRTAARDEFEIIDDITVRHLPTGVTVSTYRYSNPDDVEDLMARPANVETDYTDHSIQNVVVTILRELARRRAESGKRK